MGASSVLRAPVFRTNERRSGKRERRVRRMEAAWRTSRPEQGHALTVDGHLESLKISTVEIVGTKEECIFRAQCFGELQVYCNPVPM